MAKQQDINIIEYLKKQADKNRYRNYQDTIKEVIQRIKDIREYAERLREKSLEDPLHPMKDVNNKTDKSTTEAKSRTNGANKAGRFFGWITIMGIIAGGIIVVAYILLWRQKK